MEMVAVAPAWAASASTERASSSDAPSAIALLNALAAATRAFSKAIAEGASPDDALRSLAEAARAGATATISMQALKGRASYLGPRSVGHEDPGAVSTALILGALRDAARAGR